MKGKVLAALMVATTIVTSVPVSAAAAGRGMNGIRNYVDADGNGICDNRTGLGCQGRGRGNGLRFVDENNDGICDNFVDENNNGVCDNFSSGGRRGRGRGRR